MHGAVHDSVHGAVHSSMHALQVKWLQQTHELTVLQMTSDLVAEGSVLTHIPGFRVCLNSLLCSGFFLETQNPTVGLVVLWRRNDDRAAAPPAGPLMPRPSSPTCSYNPRTPEGAQLSLTKSLQRRGFCRDGVSPVAVGSVRTLGSLPLPPLLLLLLVVGVSRMTALLKVKRILPGNRRR